MKKIDEQESVIVQKNIDRSIKRVKKNIPKIYLNSLFGEMLFISPVLVLFYTDWAGISFTQVMVLQGWFLAWIFILEVPSGAIADYFGRKKTLVISEILHLTSVLIYAYRPIYGLFMLGEFLFAFGWSLRSGAVEAILYDTLKATGKESNSKKSFSRLKSFSLIGIVIAAPLGSWIAVSIGLRETMLLSFIPITIAVIMAILMIEPELEDKSEKENYFKILREGINYFKNKKIARIIAFDSVCIAVVSYYVIWLWQKRVQSVGISTAWFGLINVCLIVFELITMNSYSIAEKIFKSKKSVIVLTALMTGIGMLVAGLVTNSVVVVICLLVAGGFGLPRETLLMNYLNKHIPSAQRATIISTMSMMSHVIVAILNPLVGFMGDWSIQSVLIILGGIAIAWAIFTPIKENYLVD